MIARPPITEIPKTSDNTYESAYGDIWYWWRNISYMLREQFLVGIIVLVIIFAGALALYMSATRLYRSQASFVVDQSPFQFGVNQNDVEGSRLLLQSIISSITSNDMRDVIAERMKVPSQNIAIVGLGPHGSALSGPDQVNIEVTTERGSRVANIDGYSANPQFACDATNAVLDEILGLNRIGGRLNELNQQIAAAQSEVNQYIQNVSAADANRAQLEQDVLGIERHMRAGGSLESAPAFVQDQGLLDLQKKRIDADSAYSAQTQISVQGQQLRALAGSKANVDSQIDSYLHNKEIGVRSAFDDAQARVASLKDDLAQEDEVLNGLQREKTQLSNAVGDFKLRRQLGLFKPDAQANEADVIVVFDRARPAWKPSKPLLLSYLGAAFILSLILCPGVMFLRHNIDRSIKYPQQIEMASGVPCLAVLPAPTGFRSASTQSYVPEQDTVSGLSYLRNQLLRSSLMGYDNKVVSFMDLGTSEASSDWVTQLGWLLASSGKTTLLVDLDFKNPRLANVLHLPIERGLSEWVSSDAPLSTFIQKTEVDQLGLLQPGKDRRDLDIQLSRHPLAPELEKLQETWDYILIYAPSLLKNPHLLLAAPGDSPIISLVEYGKATLDDLEEVVGRCEACHFRFAGVVLHHFPIERLHKRKNIFGLGPHRYVFDQLNHTDT